ncbi:helix-turn-helix domain protein [Actinoplanes sp. SE50/110]|uniref:helix-turn-helix transcriptional regulator n=1 Tax=unclassified Actinoplanes TaxID=2626549 RepID=UPI0002DF05EB|nr:MULTISPECIES: helix-turn-helix transcriptional regulator [unclassified Actinoplanes]AEV83187.2 helix-turn-helix domain protein [Actinoplanes sp. SE50/110]SLL98990.1 transcriptional regulator [Actinoplanes sp. SE50/110]
MDRRELADFIRRCRERIRPEDAGLTSGPRRRVPGLRREELALLAGMSADYLMRLEQARSPQPSIQVLRALAFALRLDDDERDHLYLLAGQRPPAGRLAGNHVRPGLLTLLGQLTMSPAQIVTDLGDLLAQNALAETLFGSICPAGPHDHEQDHNLVWRWFNDGRLRASIPEEDHDYCSRMHVADLRAAVARRGADPAAAALVQRLRDSSAEFAEVWDRHEVAVRRNSRLRLQHPTVGLLELDFEMLLTPTEDQRLILLTAPPGTPTANYLDLLRVIGQESFQET